MKSLNRIFAAAAVAAAFVSTALAAGPSFIPVPLSPGATPGFSDETAGDQKGGWIDEGPNDLGVFAPGTRDFIGGVRFSIASERENPGRTCIVLGGPARPWMPQSAALPAVGRKGEPVSGKSLYLLHAAAGMSHSEAHGTVGTVTVVYGDGKEQAFPVRAGIEAADWAANASWENAKLAWTDYNLSTQVALFLSRFDLGDKPLRELRFSAGDSTWMVVAATVGDTVSPRPLRWTASEAISRKFNAPKPFDELPAVPAGKKPRNVIFCFGDGMGQGALDAASMHLWGGTGRLVMQQMPHAALIATHSADKPVTDSAASGTALMCGRKTKNGYIGMDPAGRPLVSLASLAHGRGMGSAVLSNDSLAGATPSSSFAHVKNRREYPAIAADAVKAGFDVIFGSRSHLDAFIPKEKDGIRTDGRDIIDEMKKLGYVYVETPDALVSVPGGKKVFGLLGGDYYEGDTAFADAAAWAIDRLSPNEKGFFLFAEGTRPDHGGHKNNPELLVSGVVQVDWLVRRALEFATKRDDTLVLVTADHETGGVQAVAGSGGSATETLHFSTFSHTGAHVPLYAWGPGAELFSGVMDNTDVAKTVAFLLGLSFPESAK